MTHSYDNRGRGIDTDILAIFSFLLGCSRWKGQFRESEKQVGDVTSREVKRKATVHMEWHEEEFKYRA